MVLNESLNKILDMKNGGGYIPGTYIQDNKSVKIKYGDSGQEYEFNLSKHKWEDGSNLITLYEEIEEEEEENYDMPVLMIMFDSVQGAKNFYTQIFTEYNKNPVYPSTAALKHKKKVKKRKSKKIKSKKIKSKRRKSKKK